MSETSISNKNDLLPSKKYKKILKLHEGSECNIKLEVHHDFFEKLSPFNVLEKITNIEDFIQLLFSQANLYGHLKRKKFANNTKEVKVGLGLNYMSVKNLPIWYNHCDCKAYIANDAWH